MPPQPRHTPVTRATETPFRNKSGAPARLSKGLTLKATPGAQRRPQARSTVGPGSAGERPRCAGSLAVPTSRDAVPARLGTHTPAKKSAAQASFRGPREEPSHVTRLVQECTSISQQNFFLGKIKRHLVRVLLLLEYPAALGAERR